MSTTSQTQITLPVGLPSLKIAWLLLPYPMSERDYDAVLGVLEMCKAELTKQPEPQEGGK